MTQGDRPEWDGNPWQTDYLSPAMVAEARELADPDIDPVDR